MAKPAIWTFHRLKFLVLRALCMIQLVHASARLCKSILCLSKVKQRCLDSLINVSYHVASSRSICMLSVTISSSGYFDRFIRMIEKLSFLTLRCSHFQVRALQRLGSRFENLSGHERYCILSGQHRTGRCSCRNNSRDSNSNNDGGARASISRIVMLAEALFEVLLSCLLDSFVE